MYCRHEAAPEPERIAENFGDWRKTVGGARCGGDNRFGAIFSRIYASRLVLKNGFYVFAGPLDGAELDHGIEREEHVAHLGSKRSPIASCVNSSLESPHPPPHADKSARPIWLTSVCDAHVPRSRCERRRLIEEPSRARDSAARSNAGVNARWTAGRELFLMPGAHTS